MSHLTYTYWNWDCQSWCNGARRIHSGIVSSSLSSHVSSLHYPLKELAEVRRTVFSLIDVQTFEVVQSKRVATQVQWHLTDVQASVLLACGEYWPHGLIPKDVFLDML
eukprot:2496807-Amphidinium_carterae.1